MILPYSVLVVDDEPDVFEVLEGILFNEGYQLQYAYNGIEALSFLEYSLPDLIFLDLMMPEMDGMEVCRRIKQDCKSKHIPIIMVTALNSKETLAQCLEAGADDFISKPVSAVEVRARARSMLRLKQQHDELEHSRQKLEQLLQLREDMAYAIVHDLRNPLAGIVFACETLKLTNLTNKQIEKLNQISASEQRLESMIDSLLLMAKLESGNALLKPELINISELLQRVITTFELQANQKKIQLISRISETKRLIMADKDLIRRVVENLLSNALKFSSQNSQIHLEVEYPPDTNTVKIRLLDQGLGVKDELKQSIFKKFEIGQRFENVAQTGLGLAFCKMAVDAHGGNLWVEDNKPKGSIFTIEL